VPRGRPRERRRAGRRPPPAGVGSRGGLRRRDGRVEHLVLHVRRRPRVVGRPVGRPHHAVDHRAPAARDEPRDRRGAPGDRRRLPRVGGGSRRLVLAPARRDPLPRLSGVQASATRKVQRTASGLIVASIDDRADPTYLRSTSADTAACTGSSAATGTSVTSARGSSSAAARSRSATLPSPSAKATGRPAVTWRYHHETSPYAERT